MGRMVLEKFHLYVPNIEVAKKIFNKSLGLEIRKEKSLENGIGSISFKLNDDTTLYCWEHNPEKEDINAFSNSINLFADAKDIKTAYECLKDTNLDVKLSRLDFDGKEYLQLHVATKSPSSFITLAEYPPKA